MRFFQISEFHFSEIRGENGERFTQNNIISARMSLLRQGLKKKKKNAETIMRRSTSTAENEQPGPSTMPVNDVVSLSANDGGFGDVDSQQIMNALNGVRSRGKYNTYTPQTR